MTYQNTAVSVLSENEASSAANEHRCICIIQDSTSESSRRHTHTLPISTTTDQLLEVVANKLKYARSTFTMTFSTSPQAVIEGNMSNRIEPSRVQTLDDVGFMPNEKTYIQVGPLNGMKPVPSQVPSISEDLNDKDATSATDWSYAKPNDDDVVIPPLAPPVPPKIGHNRRNAVSNDASVSFSESISEAASKLKGADFKGVDEKGACLIGLVNQAMTCYLNSLIQTLYMTPEFRNALYEWEYKGTEVEASTTIPFQLQRLFLALQTSDKQAVETTDLTKSFGWDSSEAWQQHDIQELCRVMFDALEQKFKETENEPSDGASGDVGEKLKDKEPEILKLYEGTMKDYVQCEECKNETCRNDTYLDIPITIRPFGSSVAYRNVLEGLKAFVEPEMLEGSNQYFCEKCNKKCDAKKGFKFTSFPYLLTLQLKRFDFDYSTFHRVKLNDKMYFPETLDLNSFVEEGPVAASKDQGSDKESDCSAELGIDEVEHEEGDASSRDSGNDDDRLCHSRHDQHHLVHVADAEEGSSVDEGIEIESQSGHNGAIGGVTVDDGIGSGTSSPGAVGGAVAKEDWKDLHATVKPQGKYIYELFSIMIHSGSAVGGHYYAYIKSFEDGQWYSFNDQIVSPISEDDIEKSYGGSGSSSSYSSSFSSSTNAYMLMYRQINPDENKAFIKTEDLPEHIKRLAKDDVEREERMKEQREIEKNTCSIKVYCRHPALAEKENAGIVEEKFDFHNSISLRDATFEAYRLLRLEDVGVKLENCRLVKYDHYHQSLEQSFDDEEGNQENPLAMLLGGPRMSYLFDLLMETKGDGERFDIYKRGGITVKVLPADYHQGCFLDQVVVRLMPDDTVYHLKRILAKRLHYPFERIRMAQEKYSCDVHFLTSASQKLQDTGVYRTMKLYVDLVDEREMIEMNIVAEDPTKKYVARCYDVKDTKLWTLIDRHANLINIEVELPEDAPKYEIPLLSITPPIFETPPSPSDSIPPLVDRSPPSEQESCPKPPPGSVRSTPSIDEGVGSYEGSGGSNSVSKTAEGSATASPTDKARPVECQAMSETQEDKKTALWESFFNDNEGTPLQQEIGTETGVQYDDLPSPTTHLRRNSEEDEGCLPGPAAFQFSANFKEELDRKLLAAGYSQSPTSSLKCEDGSSDSASQTSGEFEFQEAARQPGDGAADSAGSCSTIDSTGTLCNTTDDTVESTLDENPLPIYPHTPQLGAPAATKMSSLPGLLQPTTKVTFATTTTAPDVSTEHFDERVDKVGAVMATEHTDAFESVCDCAVNKTACRNDAKPQDIGPGYLCSACGRLKPGCMSETQGSSYFPNDGEVTAKDPESGEFMDHITPLFADVDTSECGAGDSAPVAKAKYMELSSMGGQDTEPGTSRQRTESSSSVLSDLGFGDQNQMQHSYFRACSVSTNAQKCQVLKAQMDKRTTVGGLKQKMQPAIKVPTRDFSVYRVYQSGQEIELNTLSENFLLVPNDARLRVKQQRALRKGEHRCKVFHLNLAEDNPVKPLVSWVVKKELTIRDARNIVSKELYKECEMIVKPENIRLRKKHVRNPGKIFIDTDVFGKDIIIQCHQEIFLEILQKPEQKLRHDQLAVYCRRWRPSTLTLDPIQEVIVDEDDDKYHALAGLKEKLSELSDLDADQMEWAKPKGHFPCHMSVLDIQDGLCWDPPFVNYLHCLPVNINEDGGIIFYRDKNEIVKKLTEKEKSELHQKEAARLAMANSGNTVSRGASNRPYFRKEKALKIYTVGSSVNKQKKETTTL